MTAVKQIKAQARAKSGKGAARAVRREGRTPAVIYGAGTPAATISLDSKEIGLRIRAGRFLTTILEVDVDGKPERVIPRDFQLDPVKDFPVHVDFLRIGKDTEVNVDVPVHFINEDKSPGIKRGGVLNIVRHEVEFHCPANAIPDFITVDLTGTDIGDSIHISAVTLPARVKPVISDRDFTIATIAGSSAMKPEAEETVEAAEPEAAAPAAEEK
jgi:large subunit ribosomal protein L25